MGWRSTDPVDAVWRLFCSLRLTVAILLLLLVGCAGGMFWDQTLTLQQHLDSVAHDKIALWLLRVFELGDAFHSWWFSGLLLLLALNLTACSIQRLPPIWFAIMHPPTRLSDALLRLARHRHVMHVTVPSEAATGPQRKREKVSSDVLPRRIQEALNAALPRGRCWREGDVRFWFAQRHRFARLGVYFIHAALLIVMFGSVLHTTCGVSGMLAVAEGESAHILQARGPGGITYGYDLGFWVRCNDFQLEQFVDGTPRVFASNVTVFDAADPIAPPVQATIRVGDPLHIRGYTLYQASYQPLPGPQRARLAFGRRGEPVTAVHTVALNEPVSLHGFVADDRPSVEDGAVMDSRFRGNDKKNGSFFVNPAVSSRFEEDSPTLSFPRKRESTAETAKSDRGDFFKLPTVTPIRVIDDYQGLGQAVELRHVDAHGRVEYLTVFRRYPDFDRLVRAEAWHVAFQGTDQRYATVLSVSTTWLVPCVFAGFMLLCVGLAMAFGMRYRRYYARARHLGKGTWEVAVAGFIHRRRGGFDQEFAKLVKRIQRETE